MSNFYDAWLGYWDEEKNEREQARVFINEEELEWVRTKQDWRAALICAREIGFVTTGVTMLGDIPRGWHTGRHSHGEEAIYIIQGSGFSVIDDIRYNWETGSCLFMPYGSVHQHFNSGEEKVRYLSAMALPLERFAGMARIIQYEEAWENYMGQTDNIKMAESEIHPEHGRIVLQLKDAPVVTAEEFGSYLSKLKDEFTESQPKEMKTVGVPGHRSRLVMFMGGPENNFKAREIEITSILCDEPGMHSGKHSHMEALLYVLQGEGYSIVDDRRFEWKKGTLFQVQGPDTVHQHFNTSNTEAQQLRIHFGIRAQFFQKIAKGVFPYRYYEFSSYK
ncbi:MAG: cupin domain-containing protein [Dehalococcoidia bacterium]|nr:cupin domain-containing protein [Dehalococcoidia bacterium]